MNKAKVILIAVLVLVAAVIVLQNTEPVNTRLLFFSITMPRAVLLLVMGLIGFVTGIFTVFHYTGKRGKNTMAPNQTNG